jgi:hypothetical protein
VAAVLVQLLEGLGFLDRVARVGMEQEQLFQITVLVVVVERVILVE